ncbi:hypothetical protein LINGRAPRIM_LOCUS1085 [Linum grandiflorum]
MIIILSCVAIMICLSSNNNISEAARLTDNNPATCTTYQQQVMACVQYMTSTDKDAHPSQTCCDQINTLLAPSADQLKPVCKCMGTMLKGNAKAQTMVAQCKVETQVAKCN